MLNDPSSILEPILVDTRQAATMLGIAPRTVDKYRHLGAIPSVQIGTARRYRVADLMAWIDAGCPTNPNSGARIREEDRP